MSAIAPLGPTEGSAKRGDTLVPLLRPQGGAPDPVAIATWHLALTSTIAVEVPNDLLALWLFPVSGGVVLLGPAALAQDNVPVPLPAPQLLQDDLFQLEELLRGAKYLSAIAVPIRHGARDVGVMVLGSFARGAFGPAEAVTLYCLTGRLAPAMDQLADTMQSVAPHATLEPVMTREELPEHLARAACEAANGPDLVRRVSGILYALLPHDRLEILTAGPTEGAFVPMSGNSPRRRWSSAGLGVEPFAAIVARFGEEPTLLVDDWTELGMGGEWTVGGGKTPSLPARAVLGTRLEVAGEVAGYLLLGSVARDTYRPEDEDTLALAALLLAPRVDGLRGDPRGESADAAVDAGSTRTGALPLIRAAEILAGTAHLGDGLAGFSAELHRLLPHQGISLHLRWGEDEVIALNPSAPRPFADLPAISLDAFEGATVLRAEQEWLVHTLEDGEEILVPLRVAGRTMGTLGVRSGSFASPRTVAAIARQFADVLAPHLELLRRGAALSGPGLRASNTVRA